MRTAAIAGLLVAALLLAGCGNTPLANRAVCTLDAQRMYVISLWAWVGVSAEIDRRDAAIACAPLVRQAMDAARVRQRQLLPAEE